MYVLYCCNEDHLFAVWCGEFVGENTRALLKEITLFKRAHISLRHQIIHTKTYSIMRRQLNWKL